ncbi:hypothetical protein B0H66DRAFT_578695 [Apodospora peruviana]|uniref:DUF7788 domain-containing protein n=1 Tax=Apodospora peruviana TaxID=516989 RepID=A0AAE0HU53_9PEZI|nr:hypothetical protein B0H66DRAFT_578695 [Apodospora peruviana]
MDCSIGLSLLLAEVANLPFNGAFITFSATPAVEKIDLNKPLHEKYHELSQANWNMTTNFTAVFEDLILPMAIENELTQESMVKRGFVFSDMQFDHACHGGQSAWKSSYERVQKVFTDSGYEMPELAFWNLAGGRAGYTGYGDPTAPKPLTADMEGVAMVSGYSQAMLKVFLEKGVFEEDEDEEEGDDGVVEVGTRAKRRKIDPLSTVRKAVSHKAYAMLKVVD